MKHMRRKRITKTNPDMHMVLYNTCHIHSFSQARGPRGEGIGHLPTMEEASEERMKVKNDQQKDGGARLPPAQPELPLGLLS